MITHRVNTTSDTMAHLTDIIRMNSAKKACAVTALCVASASAAWAESVLPTPFSPPDARFQPVVPPAYYPPGTTLSTEKTTAKTSRVAGRAIPSRPVMSPIYRKISKPPAKPSVENLSPPLFSPYQVPPPLAFTPPSLESSPQRTVVQPAHANGLPRLDRPVYLPRLPKLERPAAPTIEPTAATEPMVGPTLHAPITNLPATMEGLTTSAPGELRTPSGVYQLAESTPQPAPSAELEPPSDSVGSTDGNANSKTHEGPSVRPDASPTPSELNHRGELPASPVPTNSSQPAAAGGHGGFAGAGGEGCGPGCGGCFHCASPFSPDPDYSNVPFNPDWEWDPYDGKWFNCVQRPWIELGRGLYRAGETPPSKHWFGRKNPINPSFLLYGDYRTAVAYNDNGAKDKTIWAHRLNLDFDFQWTGTERLHAFWGPLDKENFTRFEADDGEIRFKEEFDDDFDTLFFEGDLGYIWGGFADKYAPFDLPFAFGRFPVFFQNGIWFNEVVEGFAFTIPARHLRIPTVSNYELTWFFGFDDVANPAFGNDDDIAHIYGTHGFWELAEGYLETGYAYLDDRTGAGLGFHSWAVSWSRRYFQRVSNAVRVIGSSGQSPNSGGRQTADGQLVLLENAWISRNPNYFVPYFNMFAGFGSPQSAARAADNILVNTGINFETDALTGYPTLDASGRDTWGGAIGFNLMGPDFSWQWIVEGAFVQTMGDPANHKAVGDQYAIGTRCQIPLNHSWIWRMDAMHGFLEDDNDISGARVELRWKF